MGLEFPAITAGHVPRARSFVASSSYAISPGSPAPAPSIFTMAAVVRLLPGANGRVWARDNGGTAGPGIRLGAGLFQWRTSATTSWQVSPTAAVPSGEWVILAGAFDGSGTYSSATTRRAAYVGRLASCSVVEYGPRGSSAYTETGAGVIDAYTAVPYGLAVSSTGTNSMTCDIALACHWGRYLSAVELLAALADPLNPRWSPVAVVAPGLYGSGIRDEVARLAYTITGTPGYAGAVGARRLLRRTTPRYVATGLATITGTGAIALALAAAGAGASTVAGAGALGLAFSLTASDSSAIIGTAVLAFAVAGAGAGGPRVVGVGAPAATLGVAIAGATSIAGAGVFGAVAGLTGAGGPRVTGAAALGCTLAAGATGAVLVAGAGAFSVALALTASAPIASTLVGGIAGVLSVRPPFAAAFTVRPPWAAALSVSPTQRV